MENKNVQSRSACYCIHGGVIHERSIKDSAQNSQLSDIKPNFSELARFYNLDRRTVKKYYDGYEGKAAQAVPKPNTSARKTPAPATAPANAAAKPALLPVTPDQFKNLNPAKNAVVIFVLQAQQHPSATTGLISENQEQQNAVQLVMCAALLTLSEVLYGQSVAKIMAIKDVYEPYEQIIITTVPLR